MVRRSGRVRSDSPQSSDQRVWVVGVRRHSARCARVGSQFGSQQGLRQHRPAPSMPVGDHGDLDRGPGRRLRVAVVNAGTEASSPLCGPPNRVAEDDLASKSMRRSAARSLIHRDAPECIAAGQRRARPPANTDEQAWMTPGCNHGCKQPSSLSPRLQGGPRQCWAAGDRADRRGHRGRRAAGQALPRRTAAGAAGRGAGRGGERLPLASCPTSTATTAPAASSS
jgi:hypothetical protein